MCTVVINDSLLGEDGLSNHAIFLETIQNVLDYYIEMLGEERMTSIRLYIDNATENSGYTPIIIPVFKAVLIIKLNIFPQDGEEKIAYQFSHELTHYLFYEKYGMDKDFADSREETICSAASLILIYHLYPNEFALYNDYTKSLSDDAYRKGADLAEEVGYDFIRLVELI